MHCHRCTCVVIKKLASYSGMRELVRAPPRGAHKNKCIYIQMPYHYKRMKLSADGLPVGLLRPSTPRLLVALLGRGSYPSSTRRRSRRAAGIRHLLSSRPSGLHQREGERQRRGAHIGSPASGAATPSSSTTTLARPPAERRHPSSSMATSLASAARGARQCLEAHLLQHEVQVHGGTLHARACACTTTS